MRINGAALIFFISLFFLPPSSPCQAKKKKQEPLPAEPSHQAPASVKKEIKVLSPFEGATISPILEFINEKTKLRCKLEVVRLPALREKTAYWMQSSDLYLGPFWESMLNEAAPYESEAWKRGGKALAVPGIYVWSVWRSTLALNSVLTESEQETETPLLPALTGRLTALDPSGDLLTLLTFSALYETYGRAIIEDITRAVPVYKKSPEELAFAVESGQYPGAFGVDGHFAGSIRSGYPIRLIYISLDQNRYPVTTVIGINAALIPSASKNSEGAAHVLDFLASGFFQAFLPSTVFTPVLSGSELSGGKALLPGIDLPGESVQSSDAVLLDTERIRPEELLKLFEELANPKGIRSILNE